MLMIVLNWVINNSISSFIIVKEYKKFNIGQTKSTTYLGFLKI